MSIFAPGASALKSTNQPAAFLEVCLLMDAAEKLRNGANPGVAAKNNVSVTVSIDEGVAQVTCTFPTTVSTSADGGLKYLAKEYLGGTYSVFVPGGDVTATILPDAVVQIAALLAASEKGVLPVEDQPNNIQIESSSENGTISITGTIPVSAATDATGHIQITAVDYL
jgi:hypothetical protein